jgi:iron complex outermembrane receptor protein
VERATSWTAGLDVAFEGVPGLSLGFTYFDVVFRDRIDDRALTADVLTNSAYSDAVTRNPDPALIDQLCRHNLFYLGTTESCSALSVGALVDLRVKNLQTLRTRGTDFSATWEERAPSGRFRYRLDGTYLLAFSQQEGAGLPVVDLLNTQHNPINLRFRGSLSWDRGGLGATAAINFDNGYRDTASSPERRVSSWTTCDLQLRYKVGAPGGGGWLDDTQLFMSVSNVFNASPPFLNNGAVGLGFDQENGDPSGRRVTVGVRKRW